MQRSPEMVLFGVFVMIILVSSYWRRAKLRRAVRDLSTPMRRQLGPEPMFDPPPQDQLPEGLRAYGALHRRTKWIVHICWGLAFVWLAYIITLMLGGTAQ